MTFGIFQPAVILLVLLMSGCSATKSLSEYESGKLDPLLQQILQGKEVPEKKINVLLKEDGTKLYGVIIKINNKDEIDNLGIHYNSVIDDMVTAKLSVEELRQIVKLNSVIRIETGTKSYINQ